jgi:hypothetical protein
VRGGRFSLPEGGISDSLMDPDVPYITFRTPPPSPGPQIQLGETTPTPTLSNSLITPTRKRRSVDTRPKTKQQKRKTVVDDDHMQEQAPSWDSAGADLDMGSEPGWSSPERPPPTLETDVPQDLHRAGYSKYCENIQDEGGALYQIGPDLFVVNGWDPQKKISKVCRLNHLPQPSTNCGQPSWHHLQRTTIGDSLVTVCQCLLSHPDETCVHQLFLLDYGEELFPSDATFMNGRFDISRSISI